MVTSDRTKAIDACEHCEVNKAVAVAYVEAFHERLQRVVRRDPRWLCQPCADRLSDMVAGTKTEPRAKPTWYCGICKCLFWSERAAEVCCTEGHYMGEGLEEEKVR